MKIFPPNVQGNKGPSVVCITSKNNPPYADCPPSRPPPSSPCSIWALRPALPRARRGGGAPSAQVTGHLQPPIIGNPLTSKFRFYHPYTLTPQNDRLDVAIMPCILVFVIYGRFK